MMHISVWRLGTITALLVMALLSTGCVTRVEGTAQPASRDERVNAQLALARAHIENDSWTAARQPLLRAIEIDRRRPEAFTLLAMVYEAEGDDSEAENYYRRSLRLDRNNAMTLNNYGIFLYNQGRYREAQRHLERAVVDSSYVGRSQAFMNLGLTELALENYDEAGTALRRAVRLNANQPPAHLELSYLALRQGNLGEARHYYENYLQLANQTPRSLWVGIQLYDALNDSDRVASYALQLRNLHPGTVEYQQWREMQR
jgi:type IV pilus assembly protein PilF